MERPPKATVHPSAGTLAQEIGMEPDGAGRRRSDPYGDVQVELTLIGFHRLLPTVMIAAVGMVGACVLMAQRYHDAWLWKLTTAMMAVWGVRILMAAYFQWRVSHRVTKRSATLWQNLYAAATLCSSSILAATTIHCFTHLGETARFICTVGIFTLCAGLAARLGMCPVGLYLNGLILLASLVFSLVRTQGSQSRVSCALICFFAYTYYESVQSKFHIVVEQLRSRRKMRELAEQDMLTGLANRRYFCERLAAMCLEQEQLAVLYIDLDRFKAVNDSFGHTTGDALLRQVAARLRIETRSTDLLARLGGDEFAIVQAPMATRETAAALAGRINHAIGEDFDVSGHRISIGASVGIRLASAELTTSRGWSVSPDRLLSSADAALYQVKHAGRGGFCFAGN